MIAALAPQERVKVCLRCATNSAAHDKMGQDVFGGVKY